MKIRKASITEHRDICGGYRLLDLHVPEIAAAVEPGQFVHVRIPGAGGLTLRRPFSIYRADSESLSILYKEVGQGTSAMALLRPGDDLDVLGPLGRGFPLAIDGRIPILVAGGYGVAPLYLLASRLDRTGVLFVGGATRDDILCVEEFKALGWDVNVATEDGSHGTQGLVTVALDRWLDEHAADGVAEFYSCGPDGLLAAVGERALDWGWQAWLSLDKHMGCGVGACLACVQKIRDDAGAEYWGRVCKDGPVFESRNIVW